jgi:hypothetical protein
MKTLVVKLPDIARKCHARQQMLSRGNRNRKPFVQKELRSTAMMRFGR